MRVSSLLCSVALLLALLAIASPLAVSARRPSPLARHAVAAGDQRRMRESLGTSPPPSARSGELADWRSRLAVPPGPGAFGLDISVAVNVTQFECLIEEGFSFVISRVWRSLCEVDVNAAQTIDNAWAAGMRQVDVYLYPARTCALKPEQQVQQAIAALDGHNFGK